MFGSLLAHADKKVRDQALEALANYISTNDLQELEWLKLWKGLYYCNFYILNCNRLLDVGQV